MCKNFRTYLEFQDISGQISKFQEFQDNAQAYIIRGFINATLVILEEFFFTKLAIKINNSKLKQQDLILAAD